MCRKLKWQLTIASNPFIYPYDYRVNDLKVTIFPNAFHIKLSSDLLTFLKLNQNCWQLRNDPHFSKSGSGSESNHLTEPNSVCHILRMNQTNSEVQKETSENITLANQIAN
jgi:hypothetical protein